MHRVADKVYTGLLIKFTNSGNLYRSFRWNYPQQENISMDGSESTGHVAAVSSSSIRFSRVHAFDRAFDLVFPERGREMDSPNPLSTKLVGQDEEFVRRRLQVPRLAL